MGTPVFGAYMLRIDISSWWIVPFINMKWSSFSLLIDFSLKCTLSDMSIATPAYLWGSTCLENFFPLFHSKSVFIFFQLDESFVSNIWLGIVFLIQFVILCLLIGSLKPFTFIINIERCLLFPVIFVSLLFSFTYSLFTDLLAQKCLFFLESTWITLVSSSICKSPLSIFCSAGLVAINSISFSLL
jgi:hypothetical protein